MMDGWNEDDFDTLPIKPRGKKSSSPLPSPNNNKLINVNPKSVFSQEEPLLTKGGDNSQTDLDYEVTLKSTTEDVEDDFQGVIVPRGVPKATNYQLHFDDNDFDDERDPRDSGFEPASGDADVINQSASPRKHNESMLLNNTLENITAANAEAIDERGIEGGSKKLVGEGDPVKRRGVTFQVEKNESFPANQMFPGDSTFDADDASGLNADEEFGALNKGEFIDNLDFLEKCGESDIERRERQAALARQSLYQRFDPLVKDGTPVKADRTKSAGLAALKERTEQLLQKSTLNEIAEVSQISSPATSSSVSNDNERSDRNVETTSEISNSPKAAGVGLVDPLLYTEKDMIARDAKWKKQLKQLEAMRSEEIAMRELVEQDAKEKQDSLRGEMDELRKAVAEYEKTIIQLSETTQEDTLLKQDRVSELLKEKEQLQTELNAADSSTYDAYKRMEKMKQNIDSLRQNEATLNACIIDYQQKLKDSEERYQNLRKQAEARVEKANIEIEMVKKSKEVDLAGLQAALKQLQAKHAGIEMALQQKVSENEELTKILDDLISRVTPDG